MRARRLIALALLAGTFAALSIAAFSDTPVAVRRRAPYPVRLPEGLGKSVAQQGCLVCHSAMLITQQHKDSTAWEKTVHQMEAWGAKVPPDQHAALVEYLRRNFGPVRHP